VRGLCRIACPLEYILCVRCAAATYVALSQLIVKAVPLGLVQSGVRVQTQADCVWAQQLGKAVLLLSRGAAERHDQ
jgi:hypothetical protein